MLDTISVDHLLMGVWGGATLFTLIPELLAQSLPALKSYIQALGMTILFGGLTFLTNYRLSVFFDVWFVVPTALISVAAVIWGLKVLNQMVVPFVVFNMLGFIVYVGLSKVGLFFLLRSRRRHHKATMKKEKQTRGNEGDYIKRALASKNGKQIK